MTTGAPPFPSRLERLARVGSTNDVVRGWLSNGAEEVVCAVADEQMSGRGREGRTWTARPGAALLLSVGFRPVWLAPERAWRLAAIVALAMADAAEDVAGLGTGTIHLKWPNDLVVIAAGPGASLGLAGPGATDKTAADLGAADLGAPEAVARLGATDPGATHSMAPDLGAADLGAPDVGAAEAVARLAAPIEIRKLAGILGETEGLGTADPRAIIGIGVNADWPAAAFPPELAGSMTSLREASGGRTIDRDALLDGFLDRLETRFEALRGGRFDVAGWAERQVTTGRIIRLETRDGATELVRATGVDGASGALLVEGLDGPGAGLERAVLAGEVTHLRLPFAAAV